MHGDQGNMLVNGRSTRSAWFFFPKRVSFFKLCHLLKVRLGQAPNYVAVDFCPTSNMHSHNTRGSQLNYHVDSANSRQLLFITQPSGSGTVSQSILRKLAHCHYSSANSSIIYHCDLLLVSDWKHRIWPWIFSPFLVFQLVFYLFIYRDFYHKRRLSPTGKKS